MDILGLSHNIKSSINNFFFSISVKDWAKVYAKYKSNGRYEHFLEIGGRPVYFFIKFRGG
jgi:hypothetical protein